MSNYYEPKVEELYGGLEIEAKILDVDLGKKREGEDLDSFIDRYSKEYGTKEIWVNSTLPIDYVLLLEVEHSNDGKVLYSIPEGVIRIKYLDVEDILDLGFKESETENEYFNNNIKIVHEPFVNNISIFKDDEVLVQWYNCKNKTEFKDLLKKLYIIGEFKKIEDNE